MKKRRGVARAVPPLAVTALTEMPTGALLARLRRLQWCEDRPDHSDLTPAEIASVADAILFKSDPAWEAAHRDLRAELASREHVADKPRAR